MSDKGFVLLTDPGDFNQAMKDIGITEDLSGTPGYIDTDGTIYINDKVARDLRQIGVSSHELLHGVTGKHIKALGFTAVPSAYFISSLTIPSTKALNHSSDVAFSGSVP